MGRTIAETEEEKRIFGKYLRQITSQEETLREASNTLNEILSELTKQGYGVSEVYTQQISVSTTAVQLPDYECKIAIIKNDDDSSNNVFVGDSSVSTSNGFKLTPGAGVIAAPSNLNIFYVVSDGSATVDVLALR